MAEDLLHAQSRWEAGLSCLGREAYWQAHEEWEEIWSALPKSALRFALQAMIQVAAACYKPQQVRLKQDPVARMQKGMGALIKTAGRHLEAAGGALSGDDLRPGFSLAPVAEALDDLSEVHAAWVSKGLELSQVEARVKPIAAQLSASLGGQPLFGRS